MATKSKPTKRSTGREPRVLSERLTGPSCGSGGEQSAPAPRRVEFDVMSEYVRSTVEAARSGDTEAAREILSDYVGGVDQYSERMWNQSGKGPNFYAFARYIADAFTAILAGKDPAIALGVKNAKPGRRKGAVTHDSDAMAAAFYLLVRAGITRTRARIAIRDFTGADEKTIRKALLAGQAYASAQLIDDELLKVAAAPHREKIARFLAQSKTR